MPKSNLCCLIDIFKAVELVLGFDAYITWMPVSYPPPLFSTPICLSPQFRFRINWTFQSCLMTEVQQYRIQEPLVCNSSDRKSSIPSSQCSECTIATNTKLSHDHNLECNFVADTISSVPSQALSETMDTKHMASTTTGPGNPPFRQEDNTPGIVRRESENTLIEGFEQEEFLIAISVRIARKMYSPSSYYPQGNQSPAKCDSQSLFFSVDVPAITTRDYLRRLFEYCLCDNSVYVFALIYLERLSNKYPALGLCIMNLHRLLITAVGVAVKVIQDEVYSMNHYAAVGGVPTVQEFGRLECTFLEFMEYNVQVTHEEFQTELGKLHDLNVVPSPDNSEDCISEIGGCY